MEKQDGFSSFLGMLLNSIIKAKQREDALPTQEVDVVQLMFM